MKMALGAKKLSAVIVYVLIGWALWQILSPDAHGASMSNPGRVQVFIPATYASDPTKVAKAGDTMSGDLAIGATLYSYGVVATSGAYSRLWAGTTEYQQNLYGLFPYPPLADDPPPPLQVMGEDTLGSNLMGVCNSGSLGSCQWVLNNQGNSGGSAKMVMSNNDLNTWGTLAKDTSGLYVEDSVTGSRILISTGGNIDIIATFLVDFQAPVVIMPKLQVNQSATAPLLTVTSMTVTSATIANATISSGTILNLTAGTDGSVAPLRVFGQNTYGVGGLFKGASGSLGGYGLMVVNTGGSAGIFMSNDDGTSNSLLYRQNAVNNPSGFSNNPQTAGFKVKDNSNAEFYGGLTTVTGNTSINLVGPSMARNGNTALGFHGFYSKDVLGAGCRLANPATLACSCPGTSTSQYMYQILNGDSNCLGGAVNCNMYLCWSY